MVRMENGRPRGQQGLDQMRTFLSVALAAGFAALYTVALAAILAAKYSEGLLVPAQLLYTVALAAGFAALCLALWLNAAIRQARTP